jgi:hypothetical protein
MPNEQIPHTPGSRSTKELAQRLDPRYFRSLSRGESLKSLLTWAVLALTGVAAIALSLGAGTTRNVLSPGPLSSHHALFADRCEVCHVDSFNRIPDAACLKCHDGAAHPAKSVDRGKPDRAPACAECHVEHRGDTQLARVNDGNCTVCHGSLDSHASHVQLKSRNITGFLRGRHPELSAASRSDLRPLKLDHAKHMPKKAETVGGIHLPMKCNDCHATGQNSGNMMPVTFEANCKSCHAGELEFDVYRLLKTSTPAPHTKDPASIHQYIVSSYRKLLATDPGVARRPLGNDLEAQPTSAAWLGKVVSASEKYLFGSPGGPGGQGRCAYCHEVAGVEDGFPVIARVNPIEGRFVSGRPEGEPWMPRGEFNHRMHRSVECESCHAKARESVKTSDILIPVMQACLPCHSDSRAGLDRCSECHLYHNRSLEKQKGRPTEQILSSLMGGASVREAGSR